MALAYTKIWVMVAYGSELHISRVCRISKFQLRCFVKFLGHKGNIVAELSLLESFCESLFGPYEFRNEELTCEISISRSRHKYGSLEICWSELIIGAAIDDDWRTLGGRYFFVTFIRISSTPISTDVERSSSCIHDSNPLSFL